MLYLIQ